MTNEIAIAGVAASDLALQNEDAFKESTKKDYLGRFAIMQGGSKPVKKKLIGLGVFGLVKGSDVVDFGENTTVVVLGFRLKACTLAKPFIQVYDPSTPEYKKIAELSKDRIGKKTNKQGPEFLLYLPSIDDFGVLHMNNATLQNIAPSMKPKAGNALYLDLEAELIETPDFSWYGFTVQASNTNVELPTDGRVAKMIHEFNHPKQTVVMSDTDPDDVKEGRET